MQYVTLFFAFLTVMTGILRLFIAIFEYKKINALSCQQDGLFLLK